MKHIDKRQRFKSRKLMTVQLGEGGEVIGKAFISGFTQEPGTEGDADKAGSKRKLPSDEEVEFPTFEPLEEQKWSWSAEGMTDWFDFSKMVKQHQQQGGLKEVEFLLTKEHGKHRCDVRTIITGLTQNTAFSAESAHDATEKAAQMNLYIHDAFPVPPSGEHEVFAGLKFSNSRIPPQFTFKRWLVSHLLDQATDIDTFQYPVYTKTFKKVVNESNRLTGRTASWAVVNISGKEYSSGGEETPFEDGGLAENCAALQALIGLRVAQFQNFEYGRLFLESGFKLRDLLPSEMKKPKSESGPNPPPTKKIKTPGQAILSREAYLEKLKEDLTKYSRKMRCPPPEMFTLNNPDGSFTSTVTVNWINYTGHALIGLKAMAQAAERALIQLKLLKKEDSRYLKNDKLIPRLQFQMPGGPPHQGPMPGGPPHRGLMRGGPPNRGPMRGGPPNRGLMRGGPPQSGPMRGGPGGPLHRPPTPGVHRGRGLPGGPAHMNAPGAPRGMPRQRGMPTRGMPTRGMPTRGMPTRGMRGGLAAGGRPTAPAPAGFNDPSKVTWATVKKHLKEFLEQQGEDLPTYSVGTNEQGLYTAIINLHFERPRSYTGRQQHTKMAAEQDAAELGLVGIGYLSHRVLGDQPPVPHAAPTQSLVGHNRGGRRM